MDTVSREERSSIMSKVHSVDTKPEILVRSFLHRRGFRFRLHVKTLPGHPDIVLPKYKTVIEVRGCFWHHHARCKKAMTPLSNTKFWDEKFKRNVARDRKNERMIKKLGWHLIVVWECEITPKRFPPKSLTDFIKKYKSRTARLNGPK